MMVKFMEEVQAVEAMDMEVMVEEEEEAAIATTRAAAAGTESHLVTECLLAQVVEEESPLVMECLQVELVESVATSVVLEVEVAVPAMV